MDTARPAGGLMQNQREFMERIFFSCLGFTLVSNSVTTIRNPWSKWPNWQRWAGCKLVRLEAVNRFDTFRVDIQMVKWNSYPVIYLWIEMSHCQFTLKRVVNLGNIELKYVHILMVHGNPSNCHSHGPWEPFKLTVIQQFLLIGWLPSRLTIQHEQEFRNEELRMMDITVPSRINQQRLHKKSVS